MHSKRLSLAQRRRARFQFNHFFEPLEQRLLFAVDALVEPQAAATAAEWGVTAIHAPDVWASGYTGRGVTVAVVDTGVALAHADLADRLWTNAGEVPGNGRDDDANGFIDDIAGWDFLDGDNQPDDPAGHGTHIAGIVVAGVAPPEEPDGQNSNPGDGAGEALGVAPEARVMPVRVLDGNLRGANREIAAGIRYAVDNGADIINLSIAGAENRDIRAALEYAGEHDVLVVAAAGNNRASSPSHPASASRELDNVLSAGAFRENGDRLTASNLVGASGAVQVDAPGQAIRSTFVTAPYGYQSGTSMAAPHVAGLAALLLSANPSLSAAQLRTIIVDSADPPAAGSDSAGTVNAAGALALALESPGRSPTPSSHPPVAKTVEPAPIAHQIPVEQPAEPLPPQVTPLVANSAPPIAIPQATHVVARPREHLIVPPAVNIAAESSHSAIAVPSPEPVRQPAVRAATEANDRMLRDAALLAHQVETGNTAMGWPLEDADEAGRAKISRIAGNKQHASEVKSTAAAAAARPRRSDVAAAKTAAP